MVTLLCHLRPGLHTDYNTKEPLISALLSQLIRANGLLTTAQTRTGDKTAHLSSRRFQ
jgi:hypothetical protein